MLESIQVHGKRQTVSGTIVSIDFDESGFVYENSFREMNPDDMSFKLTLEVADISSNQISYIPAKGEYVVIDELSRSDRAHPIVKNPNDISTTTVVVGHEQLESAEITNIYKLIRNAYNALDTTYPPHHLWYRMRGKKATFEGVKLAGSMIASSISMDESSNVELSQDNVELIKSATDSIEKTLRTNFSGRLSIPEDTIMNMSYKESSPTSKYEPTKGIITLTDSNEWIVTESDAEEKP
jgi:hypothetical protein